MNRNPWKILGLAATDDERTIKRAYAKALKALDPDDRNAFIALREAYEAALQEAYWRAEEAEAADDGAAEGSDWAAAYEAYVENDEAVNVRTGAQEQSPDEALAAMYDRALDALDDARQVVGVETDTQGNEQETLAAMYDRALDALDDAGQVADVEADTQGNEQGDAVPPEAHFIDQCWQSWNAAASEDELLALLLDQQQTLQDRDLDTVLDYGDALLDWFYHTDNYAPRAFSWAADAYGWHHSPNDWRMNALSERYLVTVNPKVASYPALAQWDENWQQGFWARLGQALHPLRRSEAERDFAAYCRDTHSLDVRDLPASLQALYHLRERVLFGHILSFLPLLVGAILLGSDAGEMSFWGLLLGWFAYLLGASLYETLKPADLRFSRYEGWMALGVIGGILAIAAFFSSPSVEAVRWLALNVGAMLALYLAAVVWQRMAGRQWLGHFSRWKWWWHGLAGLTLLIFWWQTYIAAPEDEGIAAIFLAAAGALFAYATLRRTTLPAHTRAQYAGALLQAAVLLPLFWAALKHVPINAQEGALYWVLRIYVITSIIAIWLTPVYRRWHYALPTLLGLAGFVAFIAGLPPVWLVTLQLGLWIALPLAILATPRFPRLGFVLPQTLRSFTQSILAIAVPLVLWHLGWYLAFAFSIGVVLYILWLDSEVDEASP